jgi:hypothetical protein
MAGRTGWVVGAPGHAESGSALIDQGRTSAAGAFMRRLATHPLWRLACVDVRRATAGLDAPPRHLGALRHAEVLRFPRSEIWRPRPASTAIA